MQQKIRKGNTTMYKQNDEEKRRSLISTICYGADSILAEKATDDSRKDAAEGIRLILDNLMQFMRDEEDAYEAVREGTALVEKACSVSGKGIIAELNGEAAAEYGIPEEQLLPTMLSAVCRRLIDHTPAQENMIVIRDIFTPGADNFKKLIKQIDFVFLIIGAEAPEYIGEEKIRELVSGLDKDVLAAQMMPCDDETLFEVYLNSFHMLKTDEGIIEDPKFRKTADRMVFVKGLQELVLETLLLTKKFLDEHGLRFYLSEGTMMGAIRHHGFIPWDDDVDIMMPRDDYNKLLRLAEEGKIPPELNFDALENNPNHWVLGAKMQLTRPTRYIQRKVMKLSKCHGPYVDIFPLDYWDKETSLRQLIATFVVKISRRFLFIKTGYSSKIDGKLYRIPVKFLCMFTTNPAIEKRAVKNMTKFINGSRKYMVNLCSYYTYKKEVFPAEYYGEPVMVQFEGHDMPVPKEYDAMLRKIYGAKYDSIPPVKVLNMRKHPFEIDEDFKEA